MNLDARTAVAIASRHLEEVNGTFNFTYRPSPTIQSVSINLLYPIPPSMPIIPLGHLTSPMSTRTRPVLGKPIQNNIIAISIPESLDTSLIVQPRTRTIRVVEVRVPDPPVGAIDAPVTLHVADVVDWTALRVVVGWVEVLVGAGDEGGLQGVREVSSKRSRGDLRLLVGVGALRCWRSKPQ